ncbi:MAG: Nif3-like dinuclear metal center hexameric protein [bacterium]|nr:Nif3-like dinuclear metal center hexameric protein [bacterium]
MRVREIVTVLDELAPPALADPEDNVGLQLGHPEGEVLRLVVALEVDRRVLDRAAEGVLLVVHHPPIYRPLASLRADSPPGRAIAALARTGAAVFACHTNYDVARGGLADWLAGTLGLEEVEVLGPGRPRHLLKLVVFVPRGHEEAIRDAWAAAGAGCIGRYSHCTFQVAGTGTFLPREGAQPYAGRVGELERARELRLETVVPEDLAGRAVSAMLRVHPYEEVAYDLYPLANPPAPWAGPGRLGRLSGPRSLESFAGAVAQALGTEVRVAAGSTGSLTRVAAVPGSGGRFWPEALAAGAEVLVTGDVDHHRALAAVEAGLSVVDPGHAASEAGFVPRVAAALRSRLGGRLEVEEVPPAKLFVTRGVGC